MSAVAPGRAATVAAALAAARRRGIDRLDAQLLLAHAFGRSRAWLLAHDDERLPEPVSGSFDAACARRAAGEPLAYLTGVRRYVSVFAHLAEAASRAAPRSIARSPACSASAILSASMRQGKCPPLRHEEGWS